MKNKVAKMYKNKQFRLELEIGTWYNQLETYRRQYLNDEIKMG